jgi:transposase
MSNAAKTMSVKSATQQAHDMVLKVRETLVGQRTALINTVRGHAAEFGITAGKGPGNIVPLLSAIEHDAAIPPDHRLPRTHSRAVDRQ